MKFNLKKPCANCPFRTDRPEQKGWLGRGRAQGIANTTGTFSCHKTTEATLGDKHASDKEQQCAGFLIMREHMQEPNQMMRIAERLGMYNHTQLDMAAPVFDHSSKFIAFHSNDGESA